MTSHTPDPVTQSAPVPVSRTSRRDRRMFALVAAGTLLMTAIQVLVGTTSAHASPLDAGDSAATVAAAPAPLKFTCPPTKRPVKDNPNHIVAPSLPAPPNQTAVCSLTKPMVLLSRSHFTSYSSARIPHFAQSYRLNVGTNVQGQYLVIPAGKLKVLYRSVQSTTGYQYTGIAMDLRVTDPQTGKVLLKTTVDLFDSPPDLPYPLQVVDATNLAEMHNAGPGWWNHVVNTHWFTPYCTFVATAVKGPVQQHGEQYVAYAGDQYYVHKTGVLPSAAPPAC